MDVIGKAFAAAVDHHRKGRLVAAEQIYRLIIEAAPAHPAALNNLSLIVPAAEALGLLRRAVAAEPDYVDALVNLSGALHARGAAAEAAIVSDRAARLIQERPGSLRHLAEMLESEQCAGNAAGRMAENADCQRAMDVADLNRIGILETEGRLDEAKRCRERLAHPRPVQVVPAPASRRTVLVLSNACAGNVPLDDLLPPQCNTRIIWHIDFATEDQARQLPPYDVAFNAVGDADLLDASFASLAMFAASRPVLNHPEAVACTRRDRLATVLHGIPGVVVPQTVRVSRSDAMDLGGVLAKAGMACPVLVRPIAGHGGDGVQMVATARELAAFRPGRADAYYVIAYHDLQHVDGYYRTYRTIFVGGAAYPHHLAISDHWLVHYLPTAMMSASWRRREEQRFLQAPDAVLGPMANAALNAINQRLGLDFAGIDYALLPDGRVLLFKADAAMLVHLRDNPADFAHKYTPTRAICAAFDAMLTRHTAPPCSPAQAAAGLACPAPLA